MKREQKPNNISLIGTKCTGCRACEQICPKMAITMVPSIEGFIYPSINNYLCINCGICLTKCHVNIDVPRGNIYKAYAVKNNNSKRIMNSASGGVCDLIAISVLKKGGIVVGAVYDENLVVKHNVINKLDDIDRLQSSKYVQSDTLTTFKLVENYVKQNVLVLYTGTPCQIGGLKAFLGKEYSSLITLDIICHGVPSPLFFKKYLDYLAKKSNTSKIQSYNFRCKNKKGWGLNYQYTFIKNGKIKSKYGSLFLDKYGKNFLEGNNYRESCYSCKYANSYRPGDLTVGDFWGIDIFHPEIESKSGISVIFSNNKKGENIINSI